MQVGEDGGELAKAANIMTAGVTTHVGHRGNIFT
jgi:hypothetical protein